jgi:hypothetical protein
MEFEGIKIDTVTYPCGTVNYQCEVNGKFLVSRWLDRLQDEILEELWKEASKDLKSIMK